MSPGAPRWFDKLLAGMVPDTSEGVDRRLRGYLAFVFILFVPTTMIFAVVDWTKGERLTSVLVGGIALILLSSVPGLRRVEDVRGLYRVVLSSAAVLLTAVLYVGGGGGYALLWYYAFPAGFYYVFGAREGSVWAVGLLIPGAAILLTPLGVEYPPALAERFVVTYALVGALALGLQRARDAAYAGLVQEKGRLEEALAEVRTLSELLPMCAWCGKVRNDQGYWSRIEEFLKDQTGTVVSHGVCEDCAGKLEAEMDQRDRASSPGLPERTG